MRIECKVNGIKEFAWSQFFLNLVVDFAIQSEKCSKMPFRSLAYDNSRIKITLLQGDQHCPKLEKNELNEIIISTHNRLAFTIQVGFKFCKFYFAYFPTFEAFLKEMPDK